MIKQNELHTISDHEALLHMNLNGVWIKSRLQINSLHESIGFTAHSALWGSTSVVLSVSLELKTGYEMAMIH
jgi:hypothetical protein